MGSERTTALKTVIPIPAEPPVREALLEHALAYASMGLAVFPLWPRGKTPLTLHGVKDASQDPTAIQKWSKRWPNANIGLAVPESYLVVDIDSEEALHRLKLQGFDLPATARASTGRGYHFWYRTPEVKVSNAVGIFPGVDIRSSSGGYVVAPPSLHSNGTIYRWVVELKRSNTADCPDWLLDKLKRSGRPQAGRSPEEWLQLISEPIPSGTRNQRLAQVAGLLYRRFSAPIATEFAYCWAQTKLAPPLPKDEVARTLSSIEGREQRRRGNRR